MNLFHTRLGPHRHVTVPRESPGPSLRLVGNAPLHTIRHTLLRKATRSTFITNFKRAPFIFRSMCDKWSVAADAICRDRFPVHWGATAVRAVRWGDELEFNSPGSMGIRLSWSVFRLRLSGALLPIPTEMMRSYATFIVHLLRALLTPPVWMLPNKEYHIGSY